MKKNGFKPKSYELPDWLKEARKEDQVIGEIITKGETEHCSQLRLYETLCRVLNDRGEWFLKILCEYRKLYGDIEPMKQPLNITSVDFGDNKPEEASCLNNFHGTYCHLPVGHSGSHTDGESSW